MKITIGQVSPVQAMYSSRYQKMVLTYWYEPFPFPLGWIPSYRGKLRMKTPKGHYKKKLYWKQKLKKFLSPKRKKNDCFVKELQKS